MRAHWSPPPRSIWRLPTSFVPLSRVGCRNFISGAQYRSVRFLSFPVVKRLPGRVSSLFLPGWRKSKQSVYWACVLRASAASCEVWEVWRGGGGNDLDQPTESGAPTVCVGGTPVLVVERQAARWQRYRVWLSIGGQGRREESGDQAFAGNLRTGTLETRSASVPKSRPRVL